MLRQLPRAVVGWDLSPRGNNLCFPRSKAEISLVGGKFSFSIDEVEESGGIGRRFSMDSVGDRETIQRERKEQFIGRVVNRLDHKNRVFFPARFKNVLISRWKTKPKLVIASNGFDPCLVLTEESEWFRGNEDLNELPLQNKKAAMVRRVIAGLAEECELDSQGRITIPVVLQNFAHLEGEVLFVGCGRCVELWNPKLFEEHLQELLNNAEQLVGGAGGGNGEGTQEGDK